MYEYDSAPQVYKTQLKNLPIVYEYDSARKFTKHDSGNPASRLRERLLYTGFHQALHILYFFRVHVVFAPTYVYSTL